MDTGLAGKRVLVTGASGGIGGACARALAGGGAEGVAHYPRGRARAEALGDVPGVRADLTQPDEGGRQFSAAGEGAEVVAHYHRGRERAEALGDVQVVGADLTQQDEVDRMFSEAGRLDVCAAVAGVWPSEDVPVWELSLERWRATLDANLTATFLTARGFLRQLEGDGALVLVGSTAGLFGEAGHAR